MKKLVIALVAFIVVVGFGFATAEEKDGSQLEQLVKQLCKCCEKPPAPAKKAPQPPKPKVAADLRPPKTAPERHTWKCGDGREVTKPEMCLASGTEIVPQSPAPKAAAPVPPPPAQAAVAVEVPPSTVAAGVVQPPVAIWVQNAKGQFIKGIKVVFHWCDLQGRQVGDDEGFFTDNTGKVVTKSRLGAECVYAQIQQEHRPFVRTAPGNSPGVVRACGKVLTQPEGAHHIFILDN